VLTYNTNTNVQTPYLCPSLSSVVHTQVGAAITHGTSINLETTVALGNSVIINVSTTGFVLTITSADRITVIVSTVFVELVMIAISPLKATTSVCFHVNLFSFLPQPKSQQKA
jgi:hypothetical protein